MVSLRLPFSDLYPPFPKIFQEGGKKGGWVINYIATAVAVALLRGTAGYGLDEQDFRIKIPA